MVLKPAGQLMRWFLVNFIDELVSDQDEGTCGLRVSREYDILIQVLPLPLANPQPYFRRWTEPQDPTGAIPGAVCFFFLPVGAALGPDRSGRNPSPPGLTDGHCGWKTRLPGRKQTPAVLRLGFQGIPRSRWHTDPGISAPAADCLRRDHQTRKPTPLT